MKHLTLVIALLLTLGGLAVPASARPVTLTTHYTPAQLAAFCAKVGGLFTPGARYQCASACTTRGDGCDVICGDTACLGIAPVRFSPGVTPFQVLKTHVGGLLPADPDDSWIVYDKTDPKPKPPPPKDVLDKTGTGGLGGKFDGVEGESSQKGHEKGIDVMSSTSGGDGVDGESKDQDHKDTIQQPPPKTTYTPPKATPPTDHSPDTGGSAGAAGGAGTGFGSGSGGLKMGG